MIDYKGRMVRRLNMWREQIVVLDD